MGTNQSDVSCIGTVKGEGYRIIHLKQNSPFQNQVDVFFDFIIDAIPAKQPKKTTKQILDKLTQGSGEKKSFQVVRQLQQIFAQNQNEVVTLKIVSTKLRNVRTIKVSPNKKWSQTDDLVGIETRLERYDEAFETYFPLSDIKVNSPVKKAGITQGQYLIGCVQFKYRSLNQFIESLTEKYFDKAVEDKHVHLALYDISNDELKIVAVLLERGWGQRGLLGCQFIEGHMNRFPKNVQLVRNALLIEKKKNQQNSKFKKQLSQCNGVSVQLVESLKNQKNKKKKNVKSLSLVQPLEVPQEKQFPILSMSSMQTNFNVSENTGQYVSMVQYKLLEKRVVVLEQMLVEIKKQIVND